MSADSPPRPRDRSGTEATIVAAAERLLLAQGWTGLNVQTLAAEAGVDRKLIYRYFDGVEGVVARLAQRLDLWLGQALAEEPASTAADYPAFVRETLIAYLRALRANPLILRLLAWEMAQDTPLLRRMEAARSDVMQAWVRARRPKLRLPPEGDVFALNAVLLAAIQHLALAAQARGRFAGLDLDDAGWTRIEAAVERLISAWPIEPAAVSA
ncbi:TetR/AcrR family transcriptional regulator [Brevundimonas sp.]|uniref:TetR/AcrR family transcriptional regulator n=1 Tax=Brevundimonas sp. TaxID=1871086 RepID=UPI002ABCC634|nr:TetR/AcrR family transcriptional regulator [Brevundimonas sp.]MDZ4365405.1 TetR/AcrR family transcriptional regulator [Brevundimonas sp.]